MAKYVVLNLADPDGIGPVSRVKSGLKVRQQRKSIGVGGDDVPVYDLFEMLDTVKDNWDANLGPQLNKVRDDCNAADKIFLCTHGTATDTDHGFAKASGGSPLATWKGFGRLMRRLFPRKDKVYQVCLVMCYGARTDTYYSRDLDHQGMVPPAQLKTSFAYKLYKYLCDGHGRNIRMTARTGAVAFDEKTGGSSVEQEAAIDIALEKEEYLRSPRVQQLVARWKQYKDESWEESEKKGLKWMGVDDKYRKNPKAYASPFSGMKLAGKAYHQMLARKNDYQMRKDLFHDLTKYGKLVYESDGAGGVRITNKYGVIGTGIGPATILYSGPFI